MHGRSSAHRVVRCVVAAGLLVLSACGGASKTATTEARPSITSTSSTSTSSTTSTTSSTSTTTSTSTSTTSPPAPSAPPSTPAPPVAPATPAPPVATAPPGPTLEGSIHAVDAARLGSSWRPGCPVGPESLRLVRVPYVDFDGHRHLGEIIVHASVAASVQQIFNDLVNAGFPIAQMRTIEQFDSSDDRSLAANNTAAFNCRRAVTTAPNPGWSEHAYGRAIDINPIQNPYLPGDGRVMPPAGQPYVDRSNLRPGMAGPGTAANEAFGRAGWSWGGWWASNPDYQHFSTSGS